jgi:hypothetical protein
MALVDAACRCADPTLLQYMSGECEHNPYDDVTIVADESGRDVTHATWRRDARHLLIFLRLPRALRNPSYVFASVCIDGKSIGDRPAMMVTDYIVRVNAGPTTALPNAPWCYCECTLVVDGDPDPIETAFMVRIEPPSLCK